MNSPPLIFNLSPLPLTPEQVWIYEVLYESPYNAEDVPVVSHAFPNQDPTNGAKCASSLHRDDKNKWHCQKCGRGFRFPKNLIAHLRTHDPTRPKPYICHCQRAFVREADFTRHQKSVCFPCVYGRVLIF